ncbi:ATP-dependent DNA helicase [Trichonephila clavipes]|nr:ATP-dependent DNA helicase [Trichonephila clavipes]
MWLVNENRGQFLGLIDRRNALATEVGMRAGADIYVIELQKGLPPHMYRLLIFAEEDEIRDLKSPDWIVSEELPEKTLDPRLHEISQSTMIHGQCGALNPNSPCMVDVNCPKRYSKQFEKQQLRTLMVILHIGLVTMQTIF